MPFCTSILFLITSLLVSGVITYAIYEECKNGFTRENKKSWLILLLVMLFFSLVIVIYLGISHGCKLALIQSIVQSL